MPSKLTGELREHLERAQASPMVDVVIELHPDEDAAPEAPRSRSEKVAALKANFSRDAAPVQEAIKSQGGEVTGEAWINRTLRARVPPHTVTKLSEHESVARIDAPRAIEPDHG